MERTFKEFPYTNCPVSTIINSRPVLLVSSIPHRSPHAHLNPHIMSSHFIRKPRLKAQMGNNKLGRLSSMSGERQRVDGIDYVLQCDVCVLENKIDNTLLLYNFFLETWENNTYCFRNINYRKQSWTKVFMRQKLGMTSNFSVCEIFMFIRRRSYVRIGHKI